MTTHDGSDSERFDPFVTGYLETPYPHLARWRRRGAVQRGVSPEQSGDDCWYVLDHATARRALTDDRLGLEFHRVVPAEFLPPIPDALAPFFSMIRQWFIFRDPPDHTRLRKRVGQAFAERPRPQIESIVDLVARDLLGEIRGSETFDAMADFALPLPILVIGEILGIDCFDLPTLKRWSHGLLAGIDLKRAQDVDVAYAEAAQAATELRAALGSLIESRRAAPRDDLLSALAGEPESFSDDDELIATCALLVFAGHETTVNLLGNGLLALLRHPDELAGLQADRASTHTASSDPSSGRLPTAIEELLRYDSPSHMTFRYAMEPLELGGRRLHPGEPIGIVIAAANRDPARFEDPDRLDLGRAPNPHLSFGAGRHACLGASLARLEARIAFSRLLGACQNLELAGSARWSPALGLRGLSHLPVRADWRDA